MFAFLSISSALFAFCSMRPRHPLPEHSFCPIYPSPTTFSAPSTCSNVRPLSICPTPSSPRTFLLPDKALPTPTFSRYAPLYPPSNISSTRYAPPHSHILPLPQLAQMFAFHSISSTFPPILNVFSLLPICPTLNSPYVHFCESAQMFAPLTKKQTPGPCRTPVLSVISSLHRGSAAPPIPAASAAYSQKRPNGR